MGLRFDDKIDVYCFHRLDLDRIIVRSACLVIYSHSDQDEAQLIQRFSPLAACFERALGTKVEYVPVSSYEVAVKAFAEDKVQLAWFGGYSALKARRAVPHSLMIAQGAETTAAPYSSRCHVEQQELCIAIRLHTDCGFVPDRYPVTNLHRVSVHDSCSVQHLDPRNPS